MTFTTENAAKDFSRSEQGMIPAMRGQLRVVRSNVTLWDRKTGEPSSVQLYAVVMK